MHRETSLVSTSGLSRSKVVSAIAMNFSSKFQIFSSMISLHESEMKVSQDDIGKGSEGASSG